MAKRIDFRNFTEKVAGELVYHMSIQSLLDFKSIYGEIKKSDVISMADSSVKTVSVFFNNRLGYCVFFIPTDESNRLNMFLFATTEAYSNLATIKESLFNLINGLQNKKICSIVYKGNKKLRSLLKANDFKFNKNIVFGKENRTFSLFIKE